VQQIRIPEGQSFAEASIKKIQISGLSLKKMTAANRADVDQRSPLINVYAVCFCLFYGTQDTNG